jgi:cell division protein FtsB
MVCKQCPYKNHCHDKGACETCDFGKKFEKLAKQNKKLKAERDAYKAENEELRKKIEILRHPNF